VGLFDYIECDMPLAECPSWATEFQTKDTPAQYMERYQIREDGTLWNGGDQLADYDGCIDFYTSNWSGSYAGSVLLTPGTGERFISVEYRCVFVDGKAVKGPVLTAREERTEGVYLDADEWNRFVNEDQSRRRNTETP
jgi:hypothetical protein